MNAPDSQHQGLEIPRHFAEDHHDNSSMAILTLVRYRCF